MYRHEFLSLILASQVGRELRKATEVVLEIRYRKLVSTIESRI